MRRRFSSEQKDKILKDLEQSGLSRAAYCRREGLCYQSVSKWVSRAGVRSTSLAVVEVKSDEVAIETQSSSGITVHVGGSVAVDFPSAVSMGQLALFCREVQQC